MELNFRGKRRGTVGRGNCQNRVVQGNVYGDRQGMFTCPTGMYNPRGPPGVVPQAFGGTSGFNSNKLAFGRCNQRNSRGKFAGRTRGPPVQEVDLTKPWVTEEIISENQKKQEYLEIWMKTKSKEDWNNYHSQKFRVHSMNQKARSVYLSNHPGEVTLWSNVTSTKQHYCKTCDRSFKTEDDLYIHKSEHETCYCDGCEFSAHPKIIKLHIKMQHESGLYKRLGNLCTEEDIAKWIEERKKRYPTRKVIEEKKTLEEEKVKRGERIKEDDSKFNKSFNNNSRTRRRKNFEKKTQKSTKVPQMKNKNKVSLVEKHLNEDLMENIRKGVPAFSGIGSAKESEPQEKNELDISDDEWETGCKSSNPVKPLINSSLGLLAEFYNSDDDGESEKPESKQPQNEVPMDCISADEGSEPEEVKTVTCKNSVTEEKSIEEKVPMNRKFLKNGKRERVQKSSLKNRSLEKGSVTLLEKLLKNEIKHERNVILQCIHHIVSRNFFKT